MQQTLTQQEQQVAEAIKAFRVERDWTFDRLSEFTGINPSTLNRIENMNCAPNARTLHKLKKFIPGVEAACRSQHGAHIQQRQGTVETIS